MDGCYELCLTPVPSHLLGKRKERKEEVLGMQIRGEVGTMESIESNAVTATSEEEDRDGPDRMEGMDARAGTSCFQSQSVHSSGQGVQQQETQDMDVCEERTPVNDVGVEGSENLSSCDSVRERMLDCISQTDAFFRSQQRGEPDLRCEEKRSIASNLLDKNLVTFLLRYGDFLQAEHLEYFESHPENVENSEVRSCFKEVCRRKEHARTIVKNRRFKALKGRVTEGDDFDEAEMKIRNPSLYEEMIGRFQSEEEKEQLERELLYKDCKLSSILLGHHDKEYYKMREREKEHEDEELDESDEECPVRKNQAAEEIEDEEKANLREEFRDIVFENFLEGKEEDFDYAQVDRNDEFDDLEMEDQDAEDAYFDSEEPAGAKPLLSGSDSSLNTRSEEGGMSLTVEFKMLETVFLITVEPVLFLYMLGTFMQYIALQDLVYSKVCLGKYPSSTCDNLEDDAMARSLVQRESSYWILVSTVALTLPSILAVGYVGSWSDRYGRKFPLLFPCAGNVFASLVYVFLSEFPNAPVGLIILSSIISGVSGGFVCIIMASMSYISSVSSTMNRTVRISVLESMTFLGGTLGPFIGGFIMNTHGHSYVFLAILICNVLAVFYVLFVVKNVRAPRDTKVDLSSYASYFQLGHLKAFLSTCLKRRNNGLRMYLLLLIPAAMILFLVSAGSENDVAYLYSKDNPLNWTYSTYSYYFGVKYGLGALSLVVIVPILKRLCHFVDIHVCILGILSKQAGFLLLAFSTNTPMMFSVALLGMMGSCSIAAVRSLLSQLVEQEEEGKMFAMVGALEMVCTLLGSLIFNGLYPALRDIVRGLIFLISATSLLVSLFILMFLHWHMRRKGFYRSMDSDASRLPEIPCD
ncbi:unnamed protein product [Darwinula stevensoni]|uniref:Major facilitator superfamily (MFS) profile domain-containing protein n=1 Tax=Darwinula stevensoni TaxID=69355 RepID=A0A7R9FNY9_9CRUS|nr:unnamed protein product [Darwinula stevensoni]CAG0897264.1 unnamed protein product [Darwinula stevensoni]